MHVEEEVVGDMMESVLMAPGLFALRGRLRRSVRSVRAEKPPASTTSC